MTAMALSVLLQASLATAAPAQSYEEAIKKSDETGKPVLILVGATWCRYCHVAKNEVLPKLKELMGQVEFVYLDYDRDRALVKKLIRGRVIPEMIMFTKTQEGWQQRNLSPADKLPAVEAFIKAGLPKAKETTVKSP